MINRFRINEEQAKYAIENSEFPKEVINSKKSVVVIMTQDWCPQWVNMKSWVYSVETSEDIDIYELEYNREIYFNAFMDFKESVWKNFDVPYLRYYKNGELVHTSNYVNMSGFAEAAGK